MQPRMNIITLGVSDLERATVFYEHGLMLPKMNFEGSITFFNLTGTWLALFPWEQLAQDAQVDATGSGFRGITIAHIVNDEDEVVQTLAQAETAGATIVKAAQNTDWGGFSGYFSDLDGHLWEVAYNPFFWPGPK